MEHATIAGFVSYKISFPIVLTLRFPPVCWKTAEIEKVFKC